MKLCGKHTENIEIEVTREDIVKAFLDLVKNQLPYPLRQYDLCIVDEKICFWEEYCGHNRDWELVPIVSRLPDLEITDEMLEIVKFYDQIKHYKFKNL